MKILLTGSTGLVGSSILESLATENFEVWHISRNKKPAYFVDNWIKADICDVSKTMDLIRKIGKIDILIHNAAIVKSPSNIFEFEELIKANIQFTAQIFNWANENKITIFYISSMGVIQRPIPLIIDEFSKTGAQDPYFFSKLAGEQLLSLSNALNKFYVLRISSPVSLIYGNMPNTVIKKMIVSAKGLGEVHVFGKGGRKQNFVSVTDISNAILQIIREGNIESGIYNIASDSNINMGELAEIIAFKFKAKILYLGNDPLENEHWNIDIKKAKKFIGYFPKYSSKQIINELLSSI